MSVVGIGLGSSTENQSCEMFYVILRGCGRFVCSRLSTTDSTNEDRVNFDDAWKALSGQYKRLHEFFGGLATVFPGTPSVESDFSLLKMTGGKHSTNLTDFSLESKLHAKQFFELQNIKLSAL